MRTFKYMLAAFACLFAALACSGNKESKPADTVSNAQASNPQAKMLVVFFSHAGENYSVGTVDEGNTKIVANYIAKHTGAELFEIVTHKYDGMAYKPLCDLAKKEQEEGLLPPFEGSVDVSEYDVIFIGGPVWWGTWPQVMFTFFGQYDLNGKTLVPFTTHEGSRLGNCVEDLKHAYPQATVSDAFSIAGHDVRTGEAKVERWLKGLSFLGK